jgi:RecB family exonuclease
MAIVTADDATYRPLLHRVFRDNRIAVCLSDIQNLIETPLVQDLIKRMERIVQEKKTGNSGDAADFPEKAAYAEHAQAVRDWAARERLAEQLYQRAAQSGAYSLQDLRRDVQAWQTCLDSLDSLSRAKRLYGDRQVRFTRFWSEWKELIRQGKVQVDAGAGVGVQVFRPAEMRGLSYRVLFVLGLNEGRYPKQLGEHWLIERLERAASDKGAAFQRKEQVELHRLLFRYVIQSAADRLYLGYQSPQVDERNLPSSYLEAVIRAVDPGDWREPVRFQGAMSLLPIPDDWQEISSPQEWRERTALWIGGESTLHVGREPDLFTVARFERELARGDWPRLFEQLAVEAERNGGEPSPFAGRLQNPVIRTILAQQYGPQFAWSVSMINEYAVCPFKFFAGKVLRIEVKEAPEDGISVQDRGIFLHDLNQRLLLTLTEAEQVGERQARTVLDRYDLIFEETCRDWEDTELARSIYWPAEKERLRKEMRIWLERELENLLQSRMRPRHLEWSFGNRMQGEDRQPADIASTEQLISLQVGDEPMEFRGRIDRIDVTEDGTGFAIYDYKTSLTRYKGLQDLQDGTNWQLPVYLAAFVRWKQEQGEQLEPLGGGFLRMSPAAEKKRGIWAQAASDWGIRDTRKTDLSEDLSAALTEALAQIAQQRADLRDGIFDAEPRVECDPHCQYATVCRFDLAKKGRTS